ncbi:hypothetical protein BX666DRAFT_1120073 [Dichotomocladium elegans]|nr:hypothetical protein BX666DRAFT_1120073 [Dichotomocladium elegans]
MCAMWSGPHLSLLTLISLARVSSSAILQIKAPPINAHIAIGAPFDVTYAFLALPEEEEQDRTTDETQNHLYLVQGRITPLLIASDVPSPDGAGNATIAVRTPYTLPPSNSCFLQINTGPLHGPLTFYSPARSASPSPINTAAPLLPSSSSVATPTEVSVASPSSPPSQQQHQHPADAFIPLPAATIVVAAGIVGAFVIGLSCVAWLWFWYHRRHPKPLDRSCTSETSEPFVDNENSLIIKQQQQQQQQQSNGYYDTNYFCEEVNSTRSHSIQGK